MKFGIENEQLEYKKSTSEVKDAVKSISAILNKHGGGELYFGILNDGTPVGLTVNDKTMRGISQAISNHLEPELHPTISITHLEDKRCIKVTFKGNETPYYAFGRVYIRVADEDRVMSPLELESFYSQKK